MIEFDFTSVEDSEPDVLFSKDTIENLTQYFAGILDLVEAESSPEPE